MKEMSKEFKWTDAEVKKILHAATGNIKDFVMNEDGFLEEFKASHSTKDRKPLFTTEDGVDKYSGEECVLVKVKTLEISGWYNLPKNLDKLSWDFNSYKHFHSRDAAQEYVLMNKPLLSLNDIKWWIEKYFDYPGGISIEQLKELAKSKL